MPTELVICLAITKSPNRRHECAFHGVIQRHQRSRVGADQSCLLGYHQSYVKPLTEDEVLPRASHGGQSLGAAAERQRTTTKPTRGGSATTAVAAAQHARSPLHRWPTFPDANR